MHILKIYDQYQIMASLQLHQLRVAAVAQTICDAMGEKIDHKPIVQACLMHDMGNIIKFDLEAMAFPQFLQPQGQKFWQDVQKKFMERYGHDEHEATLKIAQEIGLKSNAIELIDSIGFDKLAQNYQQKNLSKMICEYADNRVSPVGIVSLEERLQDLEARYAYKFPSLEETIRRRKAQSVARQIEQYIFGQIDLLPSDITDETLDGTISKLKSFSW